MEINTRDQVVLLLTVWLGGSGKVGQKPLTPLEWNTFSLWLEENDRGLEKLLVTNNLNDFLEGWSNKTVTADRIRALLARAGALGLSLERWNRAGLWVMTCFNKDYPSRLRNRVSYIPPVFFGCGNRKLLDKGGIAVVGSRDVTDNDIEYTRRLGAEIVSQWYSVISGGARGVDEAAMTGALEKEGTVIGILAENLLRAATSSKYRQALLAGDLVLISSFNPEAGFDVGNAMARNKYIYCLSDAAIVIASTKEKGGTWSGATENLSNRWVPLWVKSTDSTGSGNHSLVAKGAQWLPDNNLSIKELIIPRSRGVQESEKDYIRPTSYESFLTQWKKSDIKGAVKKDKLIEMFNISKKCLDQWLNRGVTEGKIVKHKKPVKYQLSQGNQLMFGL
ncbi:MAG: DNA-processing protein DprA [Candidatus Omnitrophica bacterium]|jgi:predicted Rossmann fold nucleotide-binding protein DprA/Smf involved in DNA uptake|nr:DNA-processing protein DprA [Candidatus Omnitrophota bacterium]